MSSDFRPLRELFRPDSVSRGESRDPTDMPKHTRRQKTTSPARAKPRVAAAAAPSTAKPKPAKKRGRRRGLLSGLGHHEHERDILSVPSRGVEDPAPHA